VCVCVSCVFVVFGRKLAKLVCAVGDSLIASSCTSAVLGDGALLPTAGALVLSSVDIGISLLDCAAVEVLCWWMGLGLGSACTCLALRIPAPTLPFPSESRSCMCVFVLGNPDPAFHPGSPLPPFTRFPQS
jgi:hypothetical protein